MSLKMEVCTLLTSQAIFIGNLITKLIAFSGRALLPVLPDLLKAVALRLNTARNATFIQTLVLVFAQLISREQYPIDTIVSFLDQLPLQRADGPPRSALDMLLNIWCENHSSFVGFYDCKVSMVGLAKLVCMRDPRVSRMAVKGDIIVTERITTRSRSKKG